MAKRLSVSLDSDDERMVRAFRSSASPERAALQEWAANHGLDATLIGSEAAVIRALLRAGAEYLQQGSLDAGYVTLAAELTDEQHAEAREARRRHIGRSSSGH